MISLILPYWDRPGAAARSMTALARCYAGLDLEVVVVDDGSPQAFAAPAQLPFRVKVVRLPAKREPKNPCVAFNAGVAVASGEFIALSGVEMIHRTPVLEAMRVEIETRGWWWYITAACWAPDEKRWHSHSSLLPLAEEGVAMPARAHYHFLTMFDRSLWDGAGGFDEDYRDGAGYEDPDFLLRVRRAGAKFEIRDDLIIEHPRKGVRAAWTREMHERNRRIFRSKWAA